MVVFIYICVIAHLTAEDINTIVVDWSRGASSYAFGLSNIPQVGNVIAQFINILNDNFGYSPENIRIVGVGLGAHAAGIAARAVKGTVPRVIGIIIYKTYITFILYFYIIFSDYILKIMKNE